MRSPSFTTPGRRTSAYQRGQEREVRVSPLASPQTILRWSPGGDGLLAQPDCDVAAIPEATLVLLPIADSVFRLVLAVNSTRLRCGHEVVPLVSMIDQDRKPWLRGVKADSCTNAAARQAFKLGTISFDAVKHLLSCRIEQRPVPARSGPSCAGTPRGNTAPLR